MSAKGPTSAGPSALDRRGPYTIPVSAARGGPIDNDGPFTGGTGDNSLRFTQQPASQSVTSGNTATFSVTVTGGTPPYSYQWQLDSGAGFENITGATSASYETDALVLGDDGNEYRCVVTDDASAEITSNAALLTVVANLTIDTQPQPQTADIGETATFTVETSGGIGTLSYQWQIDEGGGWEDIVGATSATYETPVLTEFDDGNEYRVVVTRGSEQAVSDAALLTVGAAFSPIDNPDVVEVYNAWDTSRHTYVAARTLVSYETTGGVTTVTCGQNPTGFSITGSGDVVIIASGDPEIDGEWTVTAVSGATFSFANPLGSTTSSPVSVSGTVQWKHRKVSAVLGMRGLYSFTQSTLANMPQWDATAKEMLLIESRQYYFEVSNSIRNALQVTSQARAVAIVARKPANQVNGRWHGWASTSLNDFGVYNRSNNTTIVIENGSTGALSWNDASINNGGTKLYVGQLSIAGRWLYVNDMATARATDASNGTNDGAGSTWVIGRNGNNYTTGACNLIIYADALLDQTYRENVKAWAEEQMFPTTFG